MIKELLLLSLCMLCICARKVCLECDDQESILLKNNVFCDCEMDLDILSRYLPAYKLDSSYKMKSARVPSLSYSEGMLSNLNGSVWRLKFHYNPDLSEYKKVEVSFQQSVLSIKRRDVEDNIIECNKYYLYPVKMFGTSSGIFAYVCHTKNIFFVYLRMIVPYLMALEMVTTYEEAELMQGKSITELGVFTLL